MGNLPLSLVRKGSAIRLILFLAVALILGFAIGIFANKVLERDIQSVVLQRIRDTSNNSLDFGENYLPLRDSLVSGCGIHNISKERNKKIAVVIMLAQVVGTDIQTLVALHQTGIIMDSLSNWEKARYLFHQFPIETAKLKQVQRANNGDVDYRELARLRQAAVCHASHDGGLRDL